MADFQVQQNLPCITPSDNSWALDTEDYMKKAFYVNDFDPTSLGSETYYGCPVHESGRYHVYATRYNDIMENMGDSSNNIVTMEAENGIQVIREANKADYPNLYIEKTKQNFMLKFWVGKPIRMTPKCQKTSSPVDIL